jgi:hypothetical protein
MTGNSRFDFPEVRLECAGLTVGNFSVPPFHVQAGQTVCLHVSPRPEIWHEALAPILSGRIAHPALRFHGSASYLERPMPRRRWWGWLHNPSAHDWLTTERGMTSTEAATVLDMVDWPEDLSIGRMGWNERTMLALETCLLRPPDLLVFETVGHDLLTTRRIFERLSSRPPDLALIYLKTRHEMDDPCLPGGTCFDVVRAPSQAIIAE